MKKLVCNTPFCTMLVSVLAGMWGWCVTFAVATLMGFAAYSGIQTFRPHPPQLVSTGDKTWVSRVGHQMLIEYRREIEIKSDFKGTINRTIYCDNGWSHDLPSAMRSFKRGKVSAGRSLDAPFLVPIGTPCRVDTLITWKPFMSLVDHTFSVQSLPFIATDESVGRPPKVSPTEEHDHAHGGQP